MHRALAALLAFAALAASAAGQCAGGRCYAPAAWQAYAAPQPVAAAPPADRWVWGSGGWGWFQAGRQVGYFRPSDDTWHAWDGERFAPPAPPPWRAPASPPHKDPGPAAEPAPVPAARTPPAAADPPATTPPTANFGLGLAEMEAGRAARPSYSINGRPVTQAEAHAAVGVPGDATLPDDDAKPHLTIIGTEAERAKVRADLAGDAALAAERSRWRVQEYAPDEPMVRGIFAAGSPAIYLQDAGGKVLARAAAYDGPAALAEALRTKRPDYDPAKDPPVKPAPPGPPANPTPAPALPPATGWIAALAALFLLLTKKGP